MELVKNTVNGKRCRTWRARGVAGGRASQTAARVAAGDKLDCTSDERTLSTDLWYKPAIMSQA